MRVFFVTLLATLTFAAPRNALWRSRNGGKIFGGTLAAPGQFPFQISLQKKYVDHEIPICGGSILDETTVICAASCVYGENPNDPQSLQVVAGSLNLIEEDSSTQRVDVIKFTMHEDFYILLYDNDISILKVSPPFNFNSNVSAVNGLETRNPIPTGETCTVSGYAIEDSAINGYSNTLQYVNVPAVNDSSCSIFYPGEFNPDTMWCAGEGKSSCEGDTGGPITTSGNNDFLAGINSWGQECGNSDGYNPGVYTRVSSYLDWIEANR